MSDLAVATPDVAAPPALGPVIPWHCQSAADRLIGRIDRDGRSLIPKIRGIMIPITARVRRKGLQSPIRRGGITDLVRHWRERLDTFTRLGMTVDIDEDRRGVLISECRVADLEFNLCGWPDDYYEPGLSIALIRFRVAPNDISLTAERMAFISRHALGRRFQRGAGRNDSDIMDDFRHLVIGHTELTQQRLFVCRVPSGVWAGEPTTLDSQPEMLLAVKTFLGPKELR